MTSLSSVADCLSQPDPLTREVAQYLVHYAEEDDRIDYKVTFDSTEQKKWLEITKDLSAFANTYGGYLVFGIEDAGKKLVGLDRSTANSLKDTNNIHLKINRYLEPELATVRSKEFRFDGKIFVVLYIPQSTGVTHLISKDGEFTYPSGERKTVLRQGTFYIRRSASNHLADSRDLDRVVERRIDAFREALKDKIASVISAPTASEVLIAATDPEDPDASKFVYTDSPDAVPVKGISFSQPPETMEEEIAGWRALSAAGSDVLPKPIVVWKWYANRAKLEIDENLRLALFKVSLWVWAPAYYWIRGLKSAQIREVLLDAIRNRPTKFAVTQMLEAAAFLGKGTYNAALSTLGDYKSKIATRLLEYPSGGPRSIQALPRKPKPQTEKEFRRELLAELEQITKDVTDKNKIPPTDKRSRAIKLDNYLYAQDDQYK